MKFQNFHGKTSGVTEADRILLRLWNMRQRQKVKVTKGCSRENLLKYQFRRFKIVRMRMEGHKWKEIGSRMNITPDHARSQYCTAMRSMYRSQGILTDAFKKIYWTVAV